MRFNWISRAESFASRGPSAEGPRATPVPSTTQSPVLILFPLASGLPKQNRLLHVLRSRVETHEYKQPFLTVCSIKSDQMVGRFNDANPSVPQQRQALVQGSRTGGTGQ